MTTVSIVYVIIRRGTCRLKEELVSNPLPNLLDIICKKQVINKMNILMTFICTFQHLKPKINAKDIIFKYLKK